MEKETKPYVYELFRANRFIVRFPDNFEIPEWLVITCTLPVDKYNGNITVTVKCPVDSGSTQGERLRYIVVKYNVQSFG